MTASFWYFEDAAKDRLVLRPPVSGDDGPMPDDVIAVLECQQGWLTKDSVRTLRDALNDLLDEGWTTGRVPSPRTDRIATELEARRLRDGLVVLADGLRVLTDRVDALGGTLAGDRQ